MRQDVRYATLSSLKRQGQPSKTSDMRVDPEDLQMLDTSSESDDEAMFPSEHVAPSSTLHENNPPPHATQPSGRAPPPSQDHLIDAMDTAEVQPTKTNGFEQLLDASVQSVDQNNANGWEPRSEFAKSAEMAVEPGSCWNNKKAREECQKAWNQIEDKNFSLSE